MDHTRTALHYCKVLWYDSLGSVCLSIPDDEQVRIHETGPAEKNGFTPFSRLMASIVIRAEGHQLDIRCQWVSAYCNYKTQELTSTTDWFHIGCYSYLQIRTPNRTAWV